MKPPRILNLDEKQPVFLIMDASPIIMLAAIKRLDWLLEPCGTVQMTDMVIEEVTREPDEGDDPRREWLQYTREWIERNRGLRCLRRIDTNTFRDYRYAIAGWKSAGGKPEDRPNLRDQGEISIVETLKNYRGEIRPDETIIVLMDDRNGRDLLRAQRRINLDVFGTRVFIEALHESFGIKEAATAWQTILRVLPVADPGEVEGQFYVRRATP
jgi:predicted nucleic acid-binding protein